MSRPCCVYRTYDLGGTLLYVGSSFAPEQRYADHENRAPWWPFMVDVRESWFASEGEARAAEREAIATEHPRWNIDGRAVDHPDGEISRAFGRRSAPWLREEIELAREWRTHRRAEESARDKRLAIEDRIARIAADRMPTLASP